MKNSRTKNTILNISTNFITVFIKSIFSFITRTVFIYCLGKEALGLNGLFTNILSMLSLAELGVSSAINFSLYRPLNDNDNEKISVLMTFYKKIYKIIGFSIFIIGIIFVPMLKYLISDISIYENVYLIYLLYLINTVFSYFLSYKETLLIADQKKYKLTFIESLGLICLNLFQIIFLLLTKNYIYYLIVQIIILLLQRIISNVYVTKLYSNINFSSNQKIDSQSLDEIKKNVKAMFFHKIGDYCVNGTDNLIISSFIDVITVGIYSNYLSIISLFNTFINLIYTNMTSSLGNLLISEKENKKYNIYKKMDFIGFLIFGICSVLLINLFNDFITLWIGSEYCIDFYLVVVIVINFYLVGMRVPANTIKNAAGMFDVDKYTPLIQSLVNLIISLIFVQKIGLLGVLIGTTISSLILPSWQRPYIVYKYILKVDYREYIFTYIKYIICIVFSTIVSIFINNYITFNSIILKLILKSISSLCVFIFLVFIMFRSDDEMIYIKKLIRKGVSNKWKKKN